MCNSKLFVWNSAYEIFSRRSICECVYIGAWGGLQYTHRDTQTLLCTLVQPCSTQWWPSHASDLPCSHKWLFIHADSSREAFFALPFPFPPALVCVCEVGAHCDHLQKLYLMEEHWQANQRCSVMGNHSNKYFIPLTFDVISEFGRNVTPELKTQ